MTFTTTELTLTRTINTSAARLFHLMTDPKSRELWGAPDENSVLTLENSDLREGGRERHRCGPKDAPEFEIETNWYKLAEPHAACFTETLEIGGERIFTSLVTYTLNGDAKPVDLTVKVAITGFVPGEDMGPEVEAGWTAGLAQLQKLAESEPATV